MYYHISIIKERISMLTKEAKNKSNYYRNRFYYNAARSAFLELLKSLNLKNNDIILFPSYIGQSPVEGSGVFDPVRYLNLKYMFYKVNEDLSIDIDDIQQIIKIQNIKILFIIHYFGFPQTNIEKIADFCKINNIILIEDCAHSISSNINNIPIGQFGNFALFSLHKIFAGKTGGILQVNNNELNFYNRINIDMEDLIQFINSDINAISTNRRKNYEYYLKKLNNTNHYEIFYNELPKNTVPLNFPILIKNLDRFEVYKKLIEINVPCVSLWHTLIKEINQNLYPISQKISSSILNLPVHQDITTEDIDYIVNKLNCI